MRISDWSSDVCSSDLFETEVRALWVPSGTAANCLALAALCPPHGSVICHRDAHIENDECGAPEFYTHAAKLRLADAPGDRNSVAVGRSVVVRVACGGCRFM